MGHLATSTCLRMLRLGGATTAAESTKTLAVSKCITTRPPKRPARTTTKTRRSFCNKMVCVCVEMKYLVDAEDSKHVALSAVCAGTMYHVACLVKKSVPHTRHASLRGHVVDSLRHARDRGGGPRR